MAVETADAYVAMQTLLTKLDLPVGKGAEGLGGRLWKHIVEDGSDPDSLMLWLQDTTEYKQRFPAMESLKQKKAAITPGDYINLERSYRTSMESVGIPAKFFNDPNDFTKLIENDVNPEEFRTRLVEGYDKVGKTNGIVRQVFANYFGVEGDAALAAYFVDPEKTTPVLLRAAQAAEIGAAAEKSVGSLSLNYASRLAEMGVGYKEATANFAKMASMSSLFETNLGETAIGKPQTLDFMTDFGALKPGEKRVEIPSVTTTPATAAELAADVAFGVNTQNQKELELRLAQRKAQFDGQTQTMAANKMGETNIGSAL